MARTLITLTSDFGRRDGYPAAMKGVILGICPQARIVDVSHEIDPQNLTHAALVLASTAPRFPVGTIHLAIVDPGVGTSRRPLLIVTPNFRLIGPDNGLFSLLLSDSPAAASVVTYELDQPEYWRHPVSNTFHGRDVFAPVAAHLAGGIRPEDLGSPIEDIVTLEIPSPRLGPDSTHGEVIHVDHFGNLVTNIKLHGPAPRLQVDVLGQTVSGLSFAYAEAPGLLAIIGSHGYLELAWNLGSAASRLGAAVGTPVTVRYPPD